MPKGIQGTTSVGGCTVEWYENKDNDGPSPRGIGVTLKDHQKSKYEFHPFDPNPHANPKYNQKVNQSKFYLAAANHVAHGFAFTAADVTVPYANLPTNKIYNQAEMNKLLANDLGKKITSKKDWSKLSPDEQKTFIAEYPKKIAAYRKEQEAKQCTAEWVTHVKGKKGTTFSWEGTTYKLPNPVAM